MFAKSLIISLALTLASALDISTPTPYEIKQCEEATFVITGATGSVWPYVVKADAPCDDALRDLDEVNGDLKWKPDLSEGTKVQIMIEDEAGNEAWSGAVVITAGSDSSCVKDSSPSNSTETQPPNPVPTGSTPDTGNKDSGYTNPGYTNTSGSATPQSAANSAANSTANSAANSAPNSSNTTSTGDAAPARLVTANGVTVLTALSALALTL